MTVRKRLLLVFDFDGVLLNSYALLAHTMAAFGLDVGDEERFRNRRKFLKYLGGGKELLNNLVGISLPKTRKLRERLTECYVERGRIYPEFVPLLNEAIANPVVHCGVVSRNFTLTPGPTIRTVLNRSGVDEAELDFVIPVPIGVKKIDILAGMRSTRYYESILCADEISDHHAALAAGYSSLIGSYGFDAAPRLRERGDVPESCIFDAPAQLAQALAEHLANYAVSPSVAASLTVPSTSKGAMCAAKSAVADAQEKRLARATHAER
jgi:phosphoglycolate phosphatase-like HAD superfamily hydrolase